MPQSDELKRDLRKAKLSVWFDKNVIPLAIVSGLIAGCAIGASGMSIADRAERLETAKRHDDEIRDFRYSCRRTVDEERSKVIEATAAATSATKAAAEATQAVANSIAVDEPKPSTSSKPKTTRPPQPDLNAAVREANKRIAEGAAK